MRSNTGQIPPRRLPIGAELMPGGGAYFRVWAPRCQAVDLVMEGERGVETEEHTTLALTAEGNGYFSGFSAIARADSLYRFRIDGGARFPDPASRYQPAGPNGPSSVIDHRYPWTDQDWKGVRREGQVLYEMHIGAFTKEGTWQSASLHLPALADLGITVVEIMPVAEFPGRFGWGYDGVNLFSPTRLYGRPDDFRAFVDSAHKLGIGVVLDVVYNHFGPEGNYLRQFSESYYSNRYETEWGEPINFDGSDSLPVREFYLANVACWISEYHLDGLRLDATQAIFDRSPRHIIAEMVATARKSAGGRHVLIIAENEPQLVKALRPTTDGGFGLDAHWNDDFHHSARVALTGYRGAYYSEYFGSPQELLSAVKWNYLFQGQFCFWQGKERGNPTAGLSHLSFINYLENHDQVANSARGNRLHHQADPGNYRAMTALLLLAPATPMLFMGQEFAASSPFLYFADLNPELAILVRRGRGEFLDQFPNIALPETHAILDDPSAPETFQKCRLDQVERQRNLPTYNLHRDLLRLRREDPVFSQGFRARLEGAVLGEEAFLLRYTLGSRERLLYINLGRELQLRPIPEPLLAPPDCCIWDRLWSSEDVAYGGSGIPTMETEHFWRIQGHAAVVLYPKPLRG